MKYSIKALIIYLIGMAILALINETTTLELNTLHLSLWGFFMFGTSMAVHHFTVVASRERPQLFPTYFMAITGLKMMVYILALAIYVFIYTATAIPVIIAFLVFYLAYTVLEVISAMDIVKK